MKKIEYEPIKKLNDNNKKKVLFLALTIIMCLGISMATIYFVYGYNDDRDNTINSGQIDISLKDDGKGITLNNTVPMTDDMGVKNEAYNFTIENVSPVPINAKIELEIQEPTTMPLESLKYALYVDDVLYEKNTVDTLADKNYSLYEIPYFRANNPVNCKLVFWVDYDYSDNSGNKTFNAKVKATGESVNVIVD